MPVIARHRPSPQGGFYPHTAAEAHSATPTRKCNAGLRSPLLHADPEQNPSPIAISILQASDLGGFPEYAAYLAEK